MLWCATRPFSPAAEVGELAFSRYSSNSVVKRPVLFLIDRWWAMKDEKGVLGARTVYARGPSFSADDNSVLATVALCSVVSPRLATADRFMYGRGGSDYRLKNTSRQQHIRVSPRSKM